METEIVETSRAVEKTTTKSILGRLGHLLSAQGVEAVLGMAFFLYLARLDSGTYGEINYAMATGSMILMVVKYGLYYPMVSQLGKVGRDKAPEILGQVVIIKLLLLVPSMIVIWGVTFFRGFSLQMSWIVIMVSLGFAFEALADTFFADFRMVGRQDREARIKIASCILSYGFGFITAALGFSPMVFGMFQLVLGLVRLIFGCKDYLRACLTEVTRSLPLEAIWTMFRTASLFALIDILGTLYNKTNIFFLESAAGVKAMAYYSSTWNLVDPISRLASQQFLGWVIFPVLAVLWRKDVDKASRLVRTNCLWLLIVALPIMLFLYYESEFLIGLLYPNEYKDAVWMQKWLIWTILLSFENNLFAFVMMVAGAQRVLLTFAVLTTGLNLLFNYTLIPSMGLAGACLVIILTKLVMTVMTFSFCQAKFGIMKIRDFVFPLVLAGICLVLFIMLKSVIPFRLAGLLSVGLYSLVLWKAGRRFIGAPTSNRQPVEDS